PLPARGDRVGLAQALSNVLGNAAKFSDPGGVVSVSLAEDTGGRTASLTVRDTGMGIEPDVLSRLFQPFSHTDPSMGRTRGGLGLGLALVRRLLQSHRATLAPPSARKRNAPEF